MAEPIEIFRTGRQTANSGVTIDFSAADLAGIAASYDTGAWKAPICVGHPAHDAPAYGWVAGVKIQGDKLIADPDQVDPAFAELVRAGRYRHVSPAFYRPDDPANPKPGHYYLRHLAFLGAMPPAVKGLKPAQFGAGDTAYLVFGEAVDGGKVKRLFRRIREHILTRDGADAADRVLPNNDIDALSDGAEGAAADQGDSATMYTEAQLAARAAELDRQQVAQTARETELNARRQALDAQGAQFSERERADRVQADTAFVDGLVAQGRMLPALKPQLLAFMASVPATGELSFAEADGSTVKLAPLDLFKKFLGTAAKIISFGEAAKHGEEKLTAAFVAAPGVRMPRGRLELHNQALQYAEQNKVTYIEAVRRLEQAA